MSVLVLTNQFGEESINQVNAGSTFLGAPIATHTIVANLTGSSAAPAAATYAQIAAVLPASMLLTGLGVGANAVIVAGDTVLQALAKLQAQITALV